MDPRTALQEKLASNEREQTRGKRSLELIGQGMLLWALLVLPPAFFINGAYTLPGVLAVYFAASPLVAWYSWRLARAEIS